METKPWYTSKILWTSVVVIINGLLSLFGRHIDQATQEVLIKDLMDFSSIVVSFAGAAILVWRTKSTPILTLTKEK